MYWFIGNSLLYVVILLEIQILKVTNLIGVVILETKETTCIC